MEWLEEFVGEIATDCYHEEVFAESTKRRKQVCVFPCNYSGISEERTLKDSLLSFMRFKMYWNYRIEMLWELKLCPL